MNGIFKAEGPLLEENAHLYVERHEDRKIATDLMRGEYVALIGARQMGKTSLLLKFRRDLLEQGHVPIYLDLSPARDRGNEDWYRYLRSVMEGQLRQYSAEAALPRMRHQLDFRGALRQISLDLPPARQVVILLDQVSSVPSSVSDQFFRTVRTVHNEREVFPAFRRCVFLMAGTFVPDQLVTEPTISPFNVARCVYASDASQDELAPLVRNLEQFGCSVSDDVIGRIYEWTEGHLYLTQRLCSELEQSTGGHLTVQHVDAAAEEILGDRNIEQIYRGLDGRPEAEEYLQKVLSGDRPLKFKRTSAAPVAQLELLGVIKEGADGCCRIRNAVYRRALVDRYGTDSVEELTRLENALFEYFCQNVNRTCTYYEIATEIWGETAWSERKIMERIYQLVARVRRKVEADPASTLEIKTIRERGYRPQRIG